MLEMPTSTIYSKQAATTLFRQLAQKIEMDSVTNEQYYAWLDNTKASIGAHVRGAEIVEKPHARVNPPLNVAIYYDTTEYALLPTGALLRTSCNVVTHAFCAFKAVETDGGVRDDYRYIFEGHEKRTIQTLPASTEAAGIVYQLMARTDIEHPGRILQQTLGIDPLTLTPAIYLEDLRFTFFVWLDKQDALRCSIDRAQVADMRCDGKRILKPVSEVELAIYPHISESVSADPRVIEVFTALSESLRNTFTVPVTKQIKYQRAAAVLGVPSSQFPVL